MPPKRKNGGTMEEPTPARETKKQKIAAARTIAVQPAKTVSFASNAVAGPSSKTQTKNSLLGLPSAIDVERFAEARAFEIEAMHHAMKSAGASSTQRAWQALPRHLRRRAASHDVRRVPIRLRGKARAEMDPVRKNISSHSTSKRGKEKRVSRTESFLKRQRDKTWLESHLWHAKRMKMENMWGYRLALHPTEKAFRPSHRASLHGSILHDASYYSLLEIKGPENVLRSILEACCDPQGHGPGAKRYLTGARSLETCIYKPGSYPFDLLGPMTVIWKPLTAPPVSASDSSATANETLAQESEGQEGSVKRKRKGKGKAKQNVPPSIADPAVSRVVWLRSHPSIFDEVFSSLQTAASLILDAARRNAGGHTVDFDIEIADLRGHVNAFEIMGPKANQVLKGAMSPIPQDQRQEFNEFWSMLTNLQTSGSVPRGMIIGFKVIDPRLKFPPKNARPKPPSLEHMPAIMTTFPSPSLAESEIWDESVRKAITKPRYKKKDLDERRSKILIPGTPLNPLRQDDRIPVMLIQRSLEASNSESQAIHGWTLIIPAGWSMAFFSSLTFTGTRVGGQRERQTQSFEAGTAYFPRDFPSSASYDKYGAERENEDKSRWERKPPAKRPNFEKLGTRNPWRADWEALLGLTSNKEQEGDGLVTTQRETEIDVDKPEVGKWLLRGSEVPNIILSVSKLFNHGAGLLQEMNRLRTKRGQEPLDPSIKADSLLRAALVSVKLKVCKRGVPDDLALIYSIDDGEIRKWEKVLQKHKKPGVDLDEDSPEEAELSAMVPSESSIIGYVTTGHFSLSQGGGFAIGVIPVVRFLELQEQNYRIHPNQGTRPSPLVVKVRNGNSQQCRVAHLELLDA